MNVLSAAMRLLEKAGSPLHVEDLARQMVAEGLWETDGKKPAATVGARIYSDIKSKGDRSPFAKVAPQTFALRDFQEGEAPSAASVEKAPRPSSGTGFLSFADCAQKVLEEFGGRKPMHYRKIAEKALEEGWLATSGKTPESSMHARIVAEIRRQQKRGERPRFVQHGRGYVGLSQWMGRGLAFQIEQHNQQVRQALRQRLLSMKPGEFEELVSQLLAEMGF